MLRPAELPVDLNHQAPRGVDHRGRGCLTARAGSLLTLGLRGRAGFLGRGLLMLTPGEPQAGLCCPGRGPDPLPKS